MYGIFLFLTYIHFFIMHTCLVLLLLFIIFNEYFMLVSNYFTFII